MFQVNVSSLSESAGLVAGDLLVAVNGEDVQSYRHKEAQDTIIRSGNNLTITVRRGGVLNQALKPAQSGRQTPLVSNNNNNAAGNNDPRAGDWNKVLDANKAGAAMNAETFTQEFMQQLMGQTASNLPPPLLSETAVNSNYQQPPPQQQQQQQQQQQVENGGRMSTPTQKFVHQQFSAPPAPAPGGGPSPAARNQMNSKQYNSPQPLYSQV